MKNKIIYAVILIIIAAAIGGWVYYQQASKNISDKAQAQAVVVAFGKKMQNVPLAGTKEIAATAIQNNYADYVAPQLLNAWIYDPTKAPGRLTSSPWPDRIEISSIAKNRDGDYIVIGNVVEITSVEVENGGIADKYPILIGLKKINDKWMIWLFTKTSF
ncbi:MAG: hypothetical protein WC470_03490 [Candidatus Paceibacterota bacterium]